LIGSSVICEKVSTIPENALASWQDDDTNIFCLRPAGRIQTNLDDFTPIYCSGTSGAVWTIGSMFCKVKSWQEDVEQESETLGFVKEKFHVIPTPEVLYAWTEPEYHRSFLILKPLRGKTLEEVWSSLSERQRREIAVQVAEYCEILALATSDSLQTATGRGITDGFLMTPDHKDEPSWKRRTFGPLPMDDAKTHLSPMNVGSTFQFYHADLSPSNIMVSENGEVTGILDWEHAAFYPRFWIATKPHVSFGFALEGEDGEDQWAWTRLLSQALKERKFVPDVPSFLSWRRTV
jgi:serine/threonine protein kinase